MNENNIPTDDKSFSPASPSDIPSIIADVQLVSAYGEDEPAYAVDMLIQNMAPQRKILMGILEFCRSGAAVGDVNSEVARLMTYRPSVYTAYDLCARVEERGGLKKVTADGQDYDGSSIEPSITEEDGVRYYTPNDPADLFWKTTDAGARILDDDDPLARGQEFLAADPDLAPIYRRVLEMCQGQGAVLAQLEEAVDNDPLVQSPRVYAPFFLDRLERCDALDWDGTWKTTEVGAQLLSSL